MKTKLFSTLTAAAATTALLSFSAPAQAAFTFGTGGISFDRNTEVKFTFNTSHGVAQSSLQIFNQSDLSRSVATLFSEVTKNDAGGGSNNGWLGTFRSDSNLGGAVVGGDATRDSRGRLTSFGSITQSFTFLAGQIYTLGLIGNGGGGSARAVYSTSSLNSGGTQQAVFGAVGNTEGRAFTSAGNFQSTNPFSGAMKISFDDRGGKSSNDRDFQDFNVSAEAVPEPTTLAGLALGASGLAAARRRRARRASENA